MHCLTAWVQWAGQFLRCSAALPRAGGQWDFCNALPHCLDAVRRAIPALHCRAASGQRAVGLLQCTGVRVLWARVMECHTFLRFARTPLSIHTFISPHKMRPPVPQKLSAPPAPSPMQQPAPR